MGQVRFTVTSDVDAFQIRVSNAIEELQADLGEAAYTAARLGVEAVQKEHPYTDRTYQLTETARAERISLNESDMHWRKDYASFVDDKDRYNFTEHARAVVEHVLDEQIPAALHKFKSRVERG